MSTWIAPSSGTWGSSANWSGGVPDAVGAIATFSAVPFNTSINFSSLGDYTVGVLDFNFASEIDQLTSSAIFQGATGDPRGNGILRFNGGNSAAQLNITTGSLVDAALTFSSANGFSVQLDTDLAINGSLASYITFNVDVAGPGGLILNGGTVLFARAPLFTGGITVLSGQLSSSLESAFDGHVVTIGNNARFTTFGVTDVDIATRAGTTGNAGAASFNVGGNAGTADLRGTFSHLSEGTFTFDGTGTVVANFTLIQDSPTLSAITIDGATLVMGNAYNAANLLSRPGTGMTLMDNGAVLDTAAFETVISNLSFGSGTSIISTGGALRLTLTDVRLSIPASSGTIVGTAAQDSLIINTQHHFGLNFITFSNWNSNNDLITLNGSSASNTLTGSTQNDIINGFAGNDTIYANSGIDILNGGDDHDEIYVFEAASGSSAHGGSGTDELVISGAVSLGSVSGFEQLQLNPGSHLTLLGEQFNNGFASNTLLQGNGTIEVQMASGGLFFATGMTVAAGSALEFIITGAAGTEVIKTALDVANEVFGMSGADQIRTGNLRDVIQGGDGNDKIMGMGGSDLLYGGAGADQFRYLFAADSSTGVGSDIIYDFVAGTDKLDFRVLDANPNVAGRQLLNYIGTAAFTNNGVAQLRWVDFGSDLQVEIDLDGNGVADMHIALNGSGAQTLQASDFLF